MKSKPDKMEKKKVIIVGATSGIGRAYANLLIRKGWTVGIAGRREKALLQLKALAPERVFVMRIDVQAEDAGKRLERLIEETGGMDIYLHSSGIGKQNRPLDDTIETTTLRTNGEGFVRMVDTAFHYFERQGKGHLAVISSIAGTKGMGIAPAYSATKRFQNIYVDALDQLARMKGLHIRFTDIRPGFVRTELLDESYPYPMMMDADKVAVHIHHALCKRKRVAIIDWRYRCLVWGWRLLPQWLWKRLKIG